MSVSFKQAQGLERARYLYVISMTFFFFSSRRRHTRWPRDWSSDVCSSDLVTNTTAVKLMTDGILLAEMQRDRFLNAYDTIIIDEAHERSLNIDFLLGYLRSEERRVGKERRCRRARGNDKEKERATHAG